MAEVVIESEEEAGQGWRFVVLIHFSGESTSALPPRPPQHVEMTLSWADYDRWSTGTRSPSTIAAEVIKFFLTNLEAPDEKLPRRFDASLIRRRFKNVDIDATLRGG